MTERLADVTARIEGIKQLDTVVNAMTGMAAVRARVAREQIVAVDSYAASIAAAVGRVLPLLPASTPEPNLPTGVALLVFAAEQGFAGAFSERVLDRIEGDTAHARLLLVGTRGKAIAEARGITPAWSASMPSHSPGIPKFADHILHEVRRLIDAGRIGHVDAVYTDWIAGTAQVKRQQLFPVDLPVTPADRRTAPLMNMPATKLIGALGDDYFHARICNIALHAYAAENEARMAAMAAARNQIERELSDNQALERRVRQEAITAEIIELATGELAGRANRKR